jgi:endonuclease G, mitochondrial
MRRFLLTLGLLLLASCAQAQTGPCPGEFAGGRPPMLLNPRLATGTRLLCNQEYAALHSAVTRTPLWSAEHLTADQIEQARDVPREGEFHPDERLPPGERAVLSDYVRSGFDRGHMAPSGDMSTPESQQESFSLANVVPQAPELNRNMWEAIERATRGLAMQEGSLYLVTGPVFQGQRLQQLRGRVLVPSAVYKAIYDPARGQGAAYLCTNVDPTVCRTVSIPQLAQITGVNPFPGVSVAAAPLPLPTPELRRRSYRSRERSRERSFQW